MIAANEKTNTTQTTVIDQILQCFEHNWLKQTRMNRKSSVLADNYYSKQDIIYGRRVMEWLIEVRIKRVKRVKRVIGGQRGQGVKGDVVGSRKVMGMGFSTLFSTGVTMFFF